MMMKLQSQKIKAFLDEKALDLKKLQSPLVEFYNTLNAAVPNAFGAVDGDHVTNDLLSESKSHCQIPSRRLSTAVDVAKTASPGMESHTKRISDGGGGAKEQTSKEIQPPQLPEWTELLDVKQASITSSPSFIARQKKWKEELDEELEMRREMMRQAGGGKTSSPNNLIANRRRDRLRFSSPTK
ncbi:hypothetical protein Nepgr_021848 [Nepenthes gracilis]|uniref:Uncharacterized protein n=1 Tax=Nepenthes gracilis TaxID=150966 RepID=A0AAD3XW98_NEPGR|nr:hypothetical protein Nepgr_021848 [Nepenthes gracilis]